MNFKTGLITVLDKLTGGAVGDHFRAAFTSFEDSEPPADRGKFRRLTAAQRDLSPIQFDKAQRMAFFLWQRNPMARRLIQILKDFCVGDDLMVKVKIMHRLEDEPDVDTDRMEAQQLWDDFWKDPVNRLNEEFADMIQDWFLNGELILPVTVNKMNGQVRIGYIDPANVREVLLNQMNVREVEKLRFALPNSTDELTLDVVKTDLDPKSPTFEKLIGQTFFWRLNKVVNQTRGHSELMELADWLDAFEQFLFNNFEGAALRNAFFYHLKMIGSSQQDIDKMRIAAPKPGTVRITNEKAEWSVITPDLKAADTAEAARLFKNFILAGKGYPEHWFADGGQTNLATAGVMTIPTMRMLKAKQRAVKGILKDMVMFVTDQARIHNNLPLGVDEYIDAEITAFDFERKDAADIATSFAQSMTALTVAAQKNWVSQDNAKKVVDGMLQRYGIEVDENETVESIKEDKKKGGDEEPEFDLEKAMNDISKKFPPAEEPPEQQEPPFGVL